MLPPAERCEAPGRGVLLLPTPPFCQSGVGSSSSAAPPPERFGVGPPLQKIASMPPVAAEPQGAVPPPGPINHPQTGQHLFEMSIAAPPPHAGPQDGPQPQHHPHTLLEGGGGLEIELAAPLPQK